VTAASWLALVVALVFAAAAPRLARRRWGRTDAGRRFFRHPPAEAALGILGFFTLLALAAPVLAPFPPYAQLDIVALQNRPPSWTHVLGTDLYGRDAWSRLVYGARISLGVGALATLVALTVGAAVGAVAGYFRRGVDAVLMRGVDVGLAIPRIFILLMLVAVLDRLSLGALVLVIGLTSWFATSRLVRAEVLSLRERDYVAAAQALGARSPAVIARHVLPNATAPLIVSTALSIGNVMLLEAGLSFLGVGVRPPMPSWGTMIFDGRDHFFAAPWVSLFPGLAVALVVMALHAVADALRDALDPRAEAK
jgi:peptide/nickel transport system permease protein